MVGPVFGTFPRHSMYAMYAYIGVVLGNGAAYMVYMECLGF